MFQNSPGHIEDRPADAPANRPDRPLGNPADRIHRTLASTVVALGVATAVATALGVVALVGYEHQPDLVQVVHADPSLREFTRLSDREIQDAARQVCNDLGQGTESVRLANELTRTYALTGVAAGTAFVETALGVECPEHSW